MLHFNYNKVSPSVFDGGYCIKQFAFTLPQDIPIGEVVTIGRGKKLKAVYIKSEPLENTALFFDLFPPTSTGFCVLQYVKPINGYLLAYTNN